MPTTDPSPLSPKEQIKEQLEEQVIKLLAEGVSQDKVAELTGMCRATQYNRIYKNPDFRRRLLEEKRRLYEERTAQISSAIPNAIEELRRIASGKAAAISA
jgi:DNA-binding CsgD family transcriptional regulator